MFDALKRLIDNILLKFGYFRKEVTVNKEEKEEKEELMPEALKNQILHIIIKTFGFYPKVKQFYSFEEEVVFDRYKPIISKFCEETAELCLRVPSWNSENLSLIFYEYFLSEQNLKKLFLLIEIFFEELYKKQGSVVYTMTANKLNKRFKEHLFGYKFERGKIIKYNSSYLQEEVVEPALKLINNEIFSGAEREFRQALEDYRQDNNIAALNSCGRALESTIKIICDLNKWNYTPKDTAGRLINICKDNNLFEDCFYGEANSLVEILANGAPRLRNGKSGHGSGSQEKEIPDFYVDYMIHTTATVIIFLINANEHYQSKHS